MKKSDLAYRLADKEGLTEVQQIEKELKEHQDNLESLVKERTAELEIKYTLLEETNTALRALLDLRKKEKEVLENNIMVNLQQLAKPLIEKLKACSLDGQETAYYLDALALVIQDITTSFVKRMSSKNLNCTFKEIQVANLIKDGKSTNEIAEILNLSIRTIEFHRNNIRKKLGLNKTGTNLRSYLISGS